MLTGPDPRETLRLGLTHKPNYSLAGIRAYLDLLKGLCLKHWSELGLPDGAALVGLLREKWDTDLKAANGTAAKAQRKVLAQGKELADLQAAHMRLRGNLAKVQVERDELKGLLHIASPSMAAAWLEKKRKAVVKIQAPGSVLVHLGDHENTCVYLPGTVPTTPAGACVTFVTAGRTLCRCGRYRLEPLFTEPE